MSKKTHSGMESREAAMEGFVAQKLNDFETGKISRRRLIETLTLAATTVHATNVAEAQSSNPILKAQLINHFSYTCPNFREAADWYSKVLNLDQVGATDRDVVLPFGKKGEQPYGVTAKDVPLTHLVIRSRDVNGPRRSGDQPRPAPQAVIDHIAFTVADFNRDRAVVALTALGVKNIRPLNSNSVHMDDPFGYDVQLSGLDETAFTSGG
jgi:catechol 2,3-dioxygenase-like lactoylglutathione lyase family enzyme